MCSNLLAGHIAQRILENLGNQEAGVVVSVNPVSSEAELVQKLQEVERVTFGCFIGGAGEFMNHKPIMSQICLYKKLRSCMYFLQHNHEQIPLLSLCICTGIVYNELQGNDMKYTLRLRHEVGSLNTWFTRLTSPIFQFPGPRVEDKYVFIYVATCKQYASCACTACRHTHPALHADISCLSCGVVNRSLYILHS